MLSRITSFQICTKIGQHISDTSLRQQALSGDLQRACGKMHMQILQGVRWCAMSILLFLKFYNFRDYAYT